VIIGESYIKTILGLTGVYCSGKSTFDKLLIENFGFFSIDVDKIGHIVLEEKKESLVEMFGKDIVQNGKINRKELAKIVFADKDRLNLLNSIVHPAMIVKIKSIISESQSDKICINAALLFEMSLDKLCDRIIVVKSNIFNIVKRAKMRDGRGLFDVFKILSSQKVLSLAKKKSKNTEIRYINNNSTVDKLKESLEKIL